MVPTSTRSDIIPPDGVVCMLLLIMKGRFKIPVDLIGCKTVQHTKLYQVLHVTREILYMIIYHWANGDH